MISPVLYFALALLTSSPEPQPLQTMVVTASQDKLVLETAAGAITVRELTDQARPGVQLGELLDDVPGVFVQNGENFAQDVRLAVRGFGARANFGIRGLYLTADGIPQTTTDGQAQVDNLFLTELVSAEILRGPASAFYGNAAGGVVALHSQRPSGQNSIETDLHLGSFGTRRIKAAAEFESSWAARAAAQHFQSDGFRDHSRTESNQFQLLWELPLQVGEIRGVVRAVESPLAQDAGGLTQAEVDADRSQARAQNLAFNAGEAVEEIQTGLDFHASQHGVRANGFLTKRNFRGRLPFLDGGIVDLERAFFGGSLRKNFELGPGGLTLGISGDAQRDQRLRFDNKRGQQGAQTLAQDENAQAIAGFAEVRMPLHNELDLLASLRFDRLRLAIDDRALEDGDDSGARSFGEWSSSIGLSWQPSQTTQLYLRRADAFESPTFSEFANPAGGGFNPDLEPQSSRSWSIGSRFHQGGFSADLAVFDVKVDDELVGFEISSQPGRSFFRNAGRSSRNGVEAELQYAQDGLRLRASYTYSDFVFSRFVTDDDDFSGNRLPGIPTHQAHLHGVWTPYSPWFVAIDLSYVSKRFANDANEASADAYWLVDLRTGLRGRAEDWLWELGAGVGNATDTEYDANVRINAFGGRFFEPAAGRNAYVNLSLSRDWGPS